MVSDALLDEVEILLDGTWEASFSQGEDATKQYELKNDHGGSGGNAYC